MADITVGEIYDALDEFCPFDTQEPWDNAGLLVGGRDERVEKLVVALDVTPETVLGAAECGARLIVSHHPVIFHRLKNLDARDPVYLLARHGMCAVSAHTCLDCAHGGVNDVLAGLLDLEGVESIPSATAQTPLLRAGTLETQLSCEDFVRRVCLTLGCRASFTHSDRPVKRVAVCGGAGGEFVDDALRAGCQALVTGEARHHEFLQARSAGITLVAAGHFETEYPVVDVLADFLKARFSRLTVIKARQSSPVSFI